MKAQCELKVGQMQVQDQAHGNQLLFRGHLEALRLERYQVQMKAQCDLKVGQMQVRVRERSRQELPVEAQCDL